MIYKRFLCWLWMAWAALATNCLAQGIPVADSIAAAHFTEIMDARYGQAAYQEANLYADSAIAAWSPLAQWDKVVAAMKVKVYTLGIIGQHDKAQEALDEMKHVCTTHVPATDASWGTFFNSRVALYIMKGEYDLAVDWSAEQIAFWQQKKGVAAAGAFINRGIAHFYISEPWEGISDCQTGLHLLKELGEEEHAFAANAYLCIGRCFLSVLQFKEAKQYFEQALTLNQSLYPLHHPNLLTVRHNIANLYLKKGDYQKAIQLGEENLAQCLDVLGKTHPLTGAVYHDIGHAYLEIKAYKAAEHHLRKSYTIRQSALPAGHPDIAMSRLYLSRVYTKTGRHQASIDIVQTALDAVEDHRAFGIFCDLFVAKADALHNQGKWAEALALINTALARYQSGQGWHTTAHKKGILEILREKVNVLDNYETLDNHERYTAMANTLKQGRDLLDSMRYFIRPEEEVGYVDLAEYINTQGSSVCFTLFQMTGEGAWLEESFIFAEKNRASLLTQSLRNRKAISFAQVPSEVLASERKAHTGLLYSEQQWQKVEKAQKGGPKSAFWAAKIRGYRFAIDSIKTIIRYTYPNYHRLKYQHQTIRLEDVQRALPDAQSLFVQYAWTQDAQLLVYFCTKNHRAGLLITGGASLNDSLQTFIDFMQNGMLAENEGYTDESRKRFADMSYHVYARILAPVLEDVSDSSLKKFVLVPHRKLCHIPFEILLSQPATQDARFKEMAYLNTQYTIRYLNAASLLTGTENRDVQNQKLMAGFAPRYPSTKLNRSMPHSLALRDAAPLTQNEPEVRTISAMLNGVSYCGKGVTERLFKSHAGEYRVLHMAMHAGVNDSLPLYSSLFFATDTSADSQAGDTDTESDDGRLYAYEIYNLPLNAELMVLSACQTSQGKQRLGEGMMSLSHAFQYAGCPNIVTSLWQADDQSTAQLMAHFYEFLKRGLSKDEALQQAKQTYLKGDNQSHPFFWAGFVLIGDDLPVAGLKGAATPRAYLVAWGLGLLLAVFGYFFLKKSR